jgi:HK97 gp10 family phage protein
LKGRRTVARSELDYDLARLENKLVGIVNGLEGGAAAVGKNGGPIALALKDGAKLIKDEMKRQAPLGKDKKGYFTRKGRWVEPRPAGLLKASIRTERVRKPHLMGVTEAVFIRPKTSGKGKAPHWHLVEFGTARTAPNRYMKRAADEMYGAAYQNFKLRLDKEANKLIRKLSRKGYSAAKGRL